MIYNERIDELTELPNFVCFYNDDFDTVYGAYGSLIYIRISYLNNANLIHGNETQLKIGRYLSANNSNRCYRMDENSFLIVLKEKRADDSTLIHLEIQRTLSKILETMDTTEIDIITKITTYDSPIKTIAEIYYSFCDLLFNERDLTASKELMHFVIGDFTSHMKDMIKNYIEMREFALIDEISEIPNSKSAKLFLNNITCDIDNYSILFIDGDNLKDFNQISYEAGNLAIYDIAAIISKSIRKTDKLFRWLNGDEFIVFAANISKDELSFLAERIRLSIQNHFSTQPVNATVSIGISMSPIDSCNLKQILENAEIANRNAKKAGKNQFLFFSDIKSKQRQ